MEEREKKVRLGLVLFMDEAEIILFIDELYR